LKCIGKKSRFRGVAAANMGSLSRVTWSLALAAPNAEDAVSVGLRQRCIPYHIFRIIKRYVYRGKVLTKHVPAFPRYVFVPPEQLWEVKNTIKGVSDIVRMGDAEAEVSDAVIDELVARGNNGDDVLHEPEVVVEPRFKFGDRVLIGGAGALSGRDGIYQYDLGIGRASILFDWFGAWTLTNLDEADLEEADKPKVESRVHRRKRRHHSRRVGKKNHIIEASAQI